MTKKEFYHLALQIPCSGITMMRIYEKDYTPKAPDPNKNYAQELLNFHPGWIIKCDYYTPIRPKLSGILYWTEKGWEENKDRIKKVFKSYIPQPQHIVHTWADFEKNASNHFLKVKRARKRKMQNLKKQLEFLNQVKI